MLSVRLSAYAICPQSYTKLLPKPHQSGANVMWDERRLPLRKKRA